MSNARSQQVVSFDTSPLRTRDQFSICREAGKQTLGITIERDEPSESPFHYKAMHRGTASVMWNWIDLSSPCVIGIPQKSAGLFSGHLVGLQYRVAGNDIASEFGSREKPTNAGDLRFFDNEQPWWYHHQGYELYSIYMRRSCLLNHVPWVRSMHGAILEDSPLARLFKKTLVSSFHELKYAGACEAEAISRCILTLATDTIKQRHINDLDSSEISSGSILGLVLDYIENNYHDRDLSPQKIARAVGVSRTKLYRLCQSFGTPMDLVRSTRLQQAARMLGNNAQVNIANLSYIVGFSGRQSFSRAFKARYDLSPREYRNEGPDVRAGIHAHALDTQPGWETYSTGYRKLMSELV